ncbi:MAG: hypothetical protein LUF92_08975 [Clostridiales bacterium]|nr:hypothetical protein [Clostridiales bacterium]
MMYRNILKRYAAVLLAGTMVFSMVGCSGKSTGDQEETTTEAVTETTTEEVADVTPDYVDGDFELPDDFDNMIYPLTSLMVESAAKGMAYYTTESDEDEADSFWCSIAVLTSLTNTYVREVDEDMDDTSFIFVSEDTAYMFAAALYDSFAQGELEFPLLSDDNSYAVYEEDNELYGFVSGNIGNMKAYITACEENGDDYLLTMELRDTAENVVCGTYEIGIADTSYEDEDNLYMYSVISFSVLEESDEIDEEFEVTTEDDEQSIDSAAEETGTDIESDEEVESTEDSSDSEESEGTDNSSGSTTSGISQSEALELAKEYYGDDAEYTYEGMVTIGDYEYYDFAVESSSVSSTDVLVSTTGNDVIGGVQNDDGSWSFDQ